MRDFTSLLFAYEGEGECIWAKERPLSAIFSQLSFSLRGRGKKPLVSTRESKTGIVNRFAE